jgi:hypothetical protein
LGPSLSGFGPRLSIISIAPRTDRVAACRYTGTGQIDHDFRARRRWIERGTEAMQGGLQDLAEEVGAATLADLGVDTALDLVDDSPMGVALRHRAQRFAESTANTSWLRVGDTLARGVRDGKRLKDLAASLKDLDGQWQGS